MDLLNEISLLAQALSGRGNDMKLVDYGCRQQQQQVVPAVRQQIPGRISQSHKSVRQQWQSQDATSSIDALLLAAGTLAEAELAAPKANQNDVAAQCQGPDLDEIATQLTAAFPEFAELLQNRLQPAAAPQEPQLDAAQQVLLQQLIVGVTQQQEQEEAQQRQRLSATVSKRQEGQYALQRHQEELALLHQKQYEIQLQQQQLEALQQQMLFMQQHGAAATSDKNLMSSKLPTLTAAGKNGSRGAGNALGAAPFGPYAAKGRISSSRPPWRTPWLANNMQSPVGKPAAAAAVSLASLDAAAAAALPVRFPYSPSAQQQRQHRRCWHQRRPSVATDQRKQQQKGSAAADVNMYGGVSDTEHGPQQDGSKQHQQLTRHHQSQRLHRVTQDSNTTGTSTPDSSTARHLQQRDEADAVAAAVAAAELPAPLSRRALLGLPPVGLGREQQQWSAGPGAAAAMQPQTKKSKQPKSHAVVFVWDLDESLVLLHSLITGSYAAAVGAADAGRLADLGRHMQALVMKLIDERMHFKQLEDVDLVHLSDVWRLAAQDKARKGTSSEQQRKVKHTGVKPQQPIQMDCQPNGLANGAAASTSSEERHQEGVFVKGGAASAGSQAADVSADPGSSLSKTGSDEVGGSSSGGVDAAAADGSGDTRRQGVAANRKPAAVAAVVPCVVAGSPNALPEPELVLRPPKLGPRPDVLKNMWEDIHKVYDAGSGVLPLPKADVIAAGLLWEELDAAIGGWLTSARRLLADLSACTDLLITHVVVGSSQLVPLLGKLMLFRLDTVFGISEVYSASTATKLICFKRIADKYGPRARYIAIGDGLEEEVCAEHMEWPFVKITLPQPPAKQPSARDKSAVGDRHAHQATGSIQAAEASLRRPRLASSCAGSSGGGGGGGDDDDDGGDEGSAGDNDSSIAAQQVTEDPGLSVHDTCRTVEAPGTSHGLAAANKRFRSDGSEALQEQQFQALQGPREQSRGVGSAEQERPRVSVDALGSGGHMLPELTAQQLIKLAISVT